MMIITKRQDNSFTFQKDILDDNVNSFFDMIAQLCNSIDADFTVADDSYGYSSLVRLYNYNTQQFYMVAVNDYSEYKNNKPVELFGYKDEEEEKTFLIEGKD